MKLPRKLSYSGTTFCDLTVLVGGLSRVQQLALLLPVLLILAIVFNYATAAGSVGESFYRLTRARLVVDISERGTVLPARVISIRSSISSNRAKLIWLLEEGDDVTKGDIIARFDSQPFEETLARAELAHVDAEAKLLNAEKGLLIHREESTAKNQAAARQRRIANLKADDQLEGSGKLQRLRIEQTANQLQREFLIAQAELQDFEELLLQGHVSNRERDKVADSYRNTQEKLSMARAELVNFEKYVWPTMVTEAELIKEAAELEFSRVKRTTAIEVRKWQSDVTRFKRELGRAEAALEKSKLDILACVISSPIDGVLLYKTLNMQGVKRKIQIGDAIWQGQTFMEIPDTTDFIVETGIREVDVATLQSGMPATVVLDAFPDNTLRAVLDKIDVVAHEDEGASYVQKYTARINLLQKFAGIHSGMSASIKVVARDIESALVIPPGALIYRGTDIIVRLRKGDALVERVVRLGASNDKWAEVSSGLEEGDVVQIGQP